MAADEPDVIPMLAYEDGPAALDWLAAAFGFRERTRMTDATGRLSHGEMEAGSGLIMLATPSPHYQGPAHHREGCATARAWSEVPYIVDGVLVHVPDVTAHHQRARDHGARILTDPQTDEYGTRYRAEDLEGHRWMFVQR
ncbi:MAG TPA: VOC family protein [Candidatus Deferrimicrobium sp.]|nr:VOC family protein [Candidatus Deferrimicrobium sp.]